MSSLLEKLTAVFIASFLSAIEIHFLRHVMLTPASISFMIASGSSLRGLSEVKNILSLCSQATSAIMGRFVLSLSPPQPTTVIIFSSPWRKFFIAARIFSNASGV